MVDAKRSLSFAFLGEDRSLGKTLKHVAGESDRAHGALGRLGKIAIGAGAVAGVTLLAKKITGLGHSAVDAYTDAAKGAGALQRIVGGTVEDASRLRHAATETGVAHDVLSKSLGILSKNLINSEKLQTLKMKSSHLEIQMVPRLVASHKQQIVSVARLVDGHIKYVQVLKNVAGPAHIVYVKALRRVTDTQSRVVKVSKDLGFAWRDARGQILPMRQLLLNIAERFEKMPNGVEKTALALKLFGRGGAALLPLLNKGRDGINELMEEADKLGLTMSTKDVAAVKAYTLEQRHFKASMEGLKITLGRELFPIFTAWTSSLNKNAPKIIEWSRDHLPGFRREAGKVASFITDKLEPGIAKLVDGFIKGEGPGGALKSALEGVGSAAGGMWQLAKPPFEWLSNHPDLFKQIAKDAGILFAVLKAKSWLTGLGLLKSASGGRLPLPGGGGAGGLLSRGATPLDPLFVAVTNSLPGAGTGPGGVPPVVMGPGGPPRGATPLRGPLLPGIFPNVMTPEPLKGLQKQVFDLDVGVRGKLTPEVAKAARAAGLMQERAGVKQEPLDPVKALDFFRKYGDMTAKNYTQVIALLEKVAGVLPNISNMRAGGVGARDMTPHVRSMVPVKAPKVTPVVDLKHVDEGRAALDRLGAMRPKPLVTLQGLDRANTQLLGVFASMNKLDGLRVTPEVDIVVRSAAAGAPGAKDMTPHSHSTVPQYRQNTTNVNIDKVYGLTLNEVLAEAARRARIAALSGGGGV